MSGDPSLDLQEAIVNTLRADSAVTAFVGQRVFDDVPSAHGADFPRISYGPEQVLSDAPGECGESYEIFVQIDVWSRTVGKVEMKRIAGAVRKALHGVDLLLDDYRLVEISHRGTLPNKDPDGTKHGIMTFRALVDEVEP